MKFILCEVLCTLTFIAVAQALGPFDFDAGCSQGNNKGKECVIIQDCPAIYKTAENNELDHQAPNRFGYGPIWHTIYAVTCKIERNKPNLNSIHTRHVCCPKYNVKKVPKFDANCSQGDNAGKKCLKIQKCSSLWKKAVESKIDTVKASEFKKYAFDRSEIEKATCKLVKNKRNHYNQQHTRYVCCPKDDLKKLVFY